MFCSNCGTKADENDKFCNECGSPIKKDEDAKISNEETNATLENESQIEESKKEKICIEEEKKADNFANIISDNMPDIPNIPNVPNANIPINYNNRVNTNVNYPDNNQDNNSKQLKKMIMITATVAILLFIAVGIIFVFKNSTSFAGEKKNRTIMIYMVGSDLESMYGAASADIREMIKSDADFENINLLIYTGGAKEWHNNDIPEDKNAIFKVTSDGLEQVEEYKQKPMGNYQTLKEFLDYSYKNYKAESYSLILWDHGGGPIYGFGIDEYNEKNYFTIDEIKKALEKSNFNGNNKLELIGFDACLMSTAEIAFALSDYAEYFIASQEVEPGNGWDYGFLEEIDSETSTEEMGKTIIDYYSDYYDSRLGGDGISLSLLKLSKIEAFEKNLNNLFSEIDDNLNVEFSTISRTRRNSKSFGQSASDDYDLVDVYDLVDRLPSKYYEQVDKVKSSLEDLVVYQKTDLKYTNGVSIYFPYNSKSGINMIMSIYEDYNFAEEYTKFIDNFSSKLTGDRLHNWSLTNEVPVSEEVGEISVTVPAEVIENYSKINYIIFEKMDDEYYMPIYKGTDVTVSGNTISTTIAEKSLVATTDDGEKIPMTAIESEAGTDYTKYLIPGILTKWSDEAYFETYEMMSVYLQLIVDDENPNGIVSGVIPMLEREENPLAPKLTLELKDWRTIQLLTYKYKIFDELGNYTSNWTGSGEVVGIEYDTQEDLKLEFENLDISKDYYCLFRITDSQGNEYTTNVVKIKDK